MKCRSAIVSMRGWHCFKYAPARYGTQASISGRAGIRRRRCGRLAPCAQAAPAPCVCPGRSVELRLVPKIGIDFPIRLCVNSKCSNGRIHCNAPADRAFRQRTRPWKCSKFGISWPCRHAQFHQSGRGVQCYAACADARHQEPRGRARGRAHPARAPAFTSDRARASDAAAAAAMLRCGGLGEVAGARPCKSSDVAPLNVAISNCVNMARSRAMLR